jgi:hypothetical protein
LNFHTIWGLADDRPGAQALIEQAADLAEQGGVVYMLPEAGEGLGLCASSTDDLKGAFQYFTK